VLDPTIARIRGQLEELAALGDAVAADAGRRIVAAVDDGLRVALLELLTTVAAEINAQLDDAHVEVRMGADPQVVLVDDADPRTPSTEDLSARLTLRLPPGLKDRVTARADREGISVNAWVLQALDRASDRPARPAGRRRPGGARARGRPPPPARRPPPRRGRRRRPPPRGAGGRGGGPPPRHRATRALTRTTDPTR
jgi:predicted HicB family RNase H-like nuclease